MAIPSVTHTFVNGTSSDAGQVNTNFTDIINSLTDGTKSLTIDALTANGAATFNGNVTLGDGTPDDITFNGSMASTLNVKTNNSFNLGSAGFGLASVYLGSSGGFTTRVLAAATANYSLTLPAAVPGSKLPLKMGAGGALTAEALTSSDLPDAGVTQAKIAPRALTVNGSDPGVGGITVSTQSGTFNTSNPHTTPQNVTNLESTITTNGRPVRVELTNDAVSGESAAVYPASSTLYNVRFLRSGNTIAYFGGGSTAAVVRTPISAFSKTDVSATTGVHTYTVQVWSDNNVQLTVQDANLVVYET